MPQNSNFRLPRGHRFFVRNGSYSYGAKSRWGHPRVHLGANGVPLGKKNGSKAQKITMPQNLNFRLPGDHRFFLKNGSNGYGDKSRWGPPRVHLGVIGSKKRVKSVKNYHAPKFEFSTTPRSSIFPKNGSYGYGAKSRLGHRRVHLGANGVRLGPKNGSKPYKITIPQNTNFRLPRDHRFLPKNGSYSYGTKSRWGLPRVHHGANGSHWVQRIGQKRRKLPCPKIRIFDYPAIIDFSQKIEVTVMAPNHGGEPLGSIMGLMGSHWVQKIGSKP